MNKPAQQLVDTFFDWYGNDPHSKNEDCYQTSVAHEKLSALLKDKFVEFFVQLRMKGERSRTVRTELQSNHLPDLAEGNVLRFRPGCVN